MNGWNTSELSTVMESLAKLQRLQYELENCYKGAYTRCETYRDLEDYITNLAEDLIRNVEGINYLDDVENEENYED